MLKHVFTVSSFTILSRITGFIRDIFMAAILGASPLGDAFLLAFRFPNFFRRLLGEGAFQSAFVPMFSSIYTQQGLVTAQLFTQEIMALLLTALAGLVGIVEVLIPLVVQHFPPHFASTPEMVHTFSYFMAILFPYIGLASAAAMFTGVLNSLERFAVGAAAPILLNIFMIGALLVWQFMGFATPAHALVWAVMLAGLGQLAWLVAATRQAGVKVQLAKLQFTEHTGAFLKRLGPGVMSAAILQLNAFIGMTMAASLPAGAISYLFYADRLVQLPLSLIGIAMSTALLPTLSRQFQQKNWTGVYKSQRQAFEVSLSLAVPATVGLVQLAEWIILVLFQRGAFSLIDALNTAHVLQWLALGIPAYVLTKIFNTFFYAHHDTKTPLYAGIIGVAVDISVMLALISSRGYLGIACATTVAYWVNALVLAGTLVYKGLWQFDRYVLGWLMRLIFVNGIVALLIYRAMQWLVGWLPILALGLIIAGALVVYGMMAWLMCWPYGLKGNK